MMNKKGNIVAIGMLALLVALLMVGALFITLGSGILTFTSDTITEVTNGLGMAGDSNLSYASEVSIGTANTSIQMLKWGSGMMIMFSLIGIIIFAGSIRLNPSGFLIGLYLILMIVLIIIAIIISNTYEEFLVGDDEIATELKSMTMANFLVLYLPLIVTVIGFAGGIYIFSGAGEGGF